MRRVLRADYEQMMLLPPTVEEWIEAEHPARFIREFVRQSGLQGLGFRSEVGEEGGPCYEPELLLRIWLYGYWRRIRSTRGLEAACKQDIGFIWLAGGQRPDHNTLWRFWDENQEGLRGLFKRTVRVALKLEMVGMVMAAVDGTKIQARCGGGGARNEADNRRVLEKLERQVAELERSIREAGSGEAEAVARLEGELRQKRVLQEKVAGALAEMEHEGARHVHPQDPQARRMSTEGRNRFSYNAQAVVDSRQQVITAVEVSNEANDARLLSPMLEKAQTNTGTPPRTAVADGGYYSAEQLARAESHADQIAVSAGARRLRAQGQPFHTSRFQHDPQRDVVRCPQGKELTFHHQQLRHGRLPVRVYRSTQTCQNCPVREHCTRDRHGRSIDVTAYDAVLRRHAASQKNPDYRALLRQRGRIVEPVFAQIKQNGSFRRWTMHGIDAARTQWHTLCATWNLQRIYRHWLTQVRAALAKILSLAACPA